MVPGPTGLLKFMLNLFCMISIHRTLLGCSDMCEPVSFKLGQMIDATKLQLIQFE